MAVPDNPEPGVSTPTGSTNGSTTSTSHNDAAGAQKTSVPGQPEPDASTPQDKQNAIQYSYMFAQDKTATPLLTSLLTATAKHIIDHVGDPSVTELTPPKLAAFYHAAGGDYDSLFKEAPSKSISYIWQALGIQHRLVQASNYDAPSIPALTVNGFVRWESLQILLGPEEHVPFMQFAVRNWALRHPASGEPFPPDLPASCFPTKCDPDVDKWHRECATKLRQQAQAADADSPPEPRRPTVRDPRINSAYSHVHSSSTRHSPNVPRAEHEYFARNRPATYTDLPSAARFTPPDYHSRRSVDEQRRPVGLAPDDPPRRRSYSDLQSPTETPKGDDRKFPPSSHHPPPRRPPPPTHQNASRLPPDPSSDSEEELVMPRRGPSPRSYGPTHPMPPPVTIRRVPHGPIPPQVIPTRTRRSEARSAEDPRRRSLRDFGSKVASFLPGSSERYRSSSRDRRGAPAIASSRSGKPSPPSRRSRSASSVSSASGSETSSLRRRRAAERGRDRDPRDRERDRERERERDRDRDRERERERERERDRQRKRDIERQSHRHDDRDWRSSHKDSPHLRPTMDRRTSSHADIDRRGSRDWDPRDRDRGRNGDRDRDGRRILTSDEREHQERERRRYKDRTPSSRGASPAVSGVHGRRYPQEMRYN